MSIHTVRSRKAVSRRLDRRNAKVEEVITAMALGAALHLHFSRHGNAVWMLTDGTYVDDEIARLVIQHPDIAGAGDSLFGDGLSQTWRYVEGRAADLSTAPTAATRCRWRACVASGVESSATALRAALCIG
jgi:hypothetical protein